MNPLSPDTAYTAASGLSPGMPTSPASTSPSPLSTCDLCDVHKHDTGGAFRVLPPRFLAFGGRAAFAGTVRSEERRVGKECWR